MSTTPDHTTTSLDTIIVEKAKLLATLRENRQTHHEIYEAACAGYWVQTEKSLGDKRTEFLAAIEAANQSFDAQAALFDASVKGKEQKSLKPFDTHEDRSNFTLDCRVSWAPSYPVNHLEDYDSAISRLEFSVAEKAALVAADFEAYVRNNWRWKESFTASNRGLVQLVTGSLYASGGGSYLLSKSYAFGLSGCAAL